MTPASILTAVDFHDIGKSAMSPDETLDKTLHAVSDPTRRRILEALKAGGSTAKMPGKIAPTTRRCLCAGDVEERVGLSQPTVSHHMAILVDSGLVEATKQGQWRWYRRNEKAIREMVKALRKKL